MNSSDDTPAEEGGGYSGARSINPEMVVLAREARGLSQAALAGILRITQGKVSKIETGLAQPTAADLERLSVHLRFPPEFFTQTERVYGFGSSCFYHRKRQSLPVKELKTIHAKINVIRLQLGRLLKSVEVESGNRFHRLDIDEYRSPEAIAQTMRHIWQLPLGPVRNLVNAIENAGGIVFQCRFGTDKIDAVSQWPRDMPPLFFINSEQPVDRWRWSLAHELGHLVMHAVPGPDAESEANRFASELLMPEREIVPELDRMNLAKALRLKPLWRVSMQAIIRRARDVKTISERHYRSLCVEVGMEGYRKEEPMPLAPEHPTVVKDLIQVFRASFGYDLAQLSRLVYSDEQQFRELFLNERGENSRS